MRTYSDALAFARGQVARPTQSWYNLCQAFSRQTFGAAAWAPSARLAFNAIPTADRHTSWPPPSGSIAYWGNDHAGAGHATPVLDTLYSNDIYRRGRIDAVKLTASASSMPFVTRWGLPYRGYITTTPSGPIAHPAVIPPAAPWGGKNIGYDSDQEAQIRTAQYVLGVRQTGTYLRDVDGDFRNAIGAYQALHPTAFAKDGSKPGVIGPHLYASLLVHYSTTP